MPSSSREGEWGAQKISCACVVRLGCKMATFHSRDHQTSAQHQHCRCHCLRGRQRHNDTTTQRPPSLPQENNTNPTTNHHQHPTTNNSTTTTTTTTTINISPRDVELSAHIVRARREAGVLHRRVGDQPAAPGEWAKAAQDHEIAADTLNEAREKGRR